MGEESLLYENSMIDRTGQLWDLGEKLEWGHIAMGKSPARHRILVVESKDLGNDRTLQKFYHLDRNGNKAAYGEDTEYGDLPWEHRKERTRVA